jgi:hypothetical protein
VPVRRWREPRAKVTKLLLHPLWQVSEPDIIVFSGEEVPLDFIRRVRLPQFLDLPTLFCFKIVVVIARATVVLGITDLWPDTM